MKKIIIADDIYSLIKEEQSFLQRADIKVFTSPSNKDVLSAHKTEKADLIITNIDTSTMSSEDLCSAIREDKELCKVSIIILCPDTDLNKRSLMCRANAFMTIPVQHSVLLDKIHQLLNIKARESFRSLLSIKVQGKYNDQPFLCTSENISASGMLFETEKILDKDDIILCTFFLPDSTRINTNAKVVRVVEKETEYDSNKYGIKFLELGANSLTAIEVFVRNNKTTQISE